MTNEEQVVGSLLRIEELLTVLVKSEFSEIISRELGDPDAKKLYEITGNFTARQAAKKIKWSISKISRTWQKWESLGLIIKNGKTYKKIF